MNEKAGEIINSVFDIDIEKTDRNEYIENIMKWDSYNIMNLLVEIETQYHKKMNLNSLFMVKTIGELIRLIEDTIN